MIWVKVGTTYADCSDLFGPVELTLNCFFFSNVSQGLMAVVNFRAISLMKALYLVQVKKFSVKSVRHLILAWGWLLDWQNWIKRGNLVPIANLDSYRCEILTKDISHRFQIVFEELLNFAVDRKFPQFRDDSHSDGIKSESSQSTLGHLSVFHEVRNFTMSHRLYIYSLTTREASPILFSITMGRLSNFIFTLTT